MATASVTEARRTSPSTTGRIEEAQTALLHARAIVDILLDCEQVDKTSAVPDALSAVLTHLQQANEVLSDLVEK